MKSNTIVTIIAVLIVGGGLYWYFSIGTQEQPALTVAGSENATQTRFKTLIGELPTSFNTAIFSDTRFAALIDLTTQISPESVGRLDPFAPIQSGTGR